MSGLLSIAYSGLNAFQGALQVTANNIVGQTIKGYSRQSIHFSPNTPNRLGSLSFGNGVNIASITRNADQFTNTQLRNTTSVKSQYETFCQQASQIDRLLVQDGSSISASMTTFFDALGQLNDSPASLASRNVVLSQSRLLANQFNSLQLRLDEYKNNSTQQISEAATQINQITTNIADLNMQIKASPTDLGLLDNRDQMLRELAEFTQINVINIDDGTVNVELASGDMLVAGHVHRTLSVNTGISNSSGTQIMVDNGRGLTNLTSRVNTGKLGGLLDYENDVVAKSSQLIGQMAIGLAQTFNAQHKLGMDLNNELGLNFFTDFNSQDLQLGRSAGSTSNTGTAVLSVAISDISQTNVSDYTFIVNDASNNEVRVIRQSDGVATTLNLTSNPPAPPAAQLVFDGMTITVDDVANLANTDSYTLTPTRGAARYFSLDINDTNQIAFASPVATQASLANKGSGQISLGSVFNSTNVNKQYSINFISPTEFNVENVTDGTISGPFPFTPNSSNTVQIPDATNPSYSVVLSGFPEAGDQFSSAYNSDGIGDNRNGLSLFGIQQNKMLSGGTGTLFDSYSSLLSDVGSQVNQANIRYQSGSVLLQNAIMMKESQSGVNLDEEAANLLRFKNSYEAAGKLMEVSNDVMNVLFQMLR